MYHFEKVTFDDDQQQPCLSAQGMDRDATPNTFQRITQYKQ